MSNASISIRIISFFEVIFRKLLVMSTLIIVNTFTVRFRPADNLLLLLLLRDTWLVVWDELIDGCRFLDVIGGLIWLALIVVIVGRLNVAVLLLFLNTTTRLLELLLRLRKSFFEFGRVIRDLMLLMVFSRVVFFRWLGTRLRCHTLGSINLSHHFVPLLRELLTVFLLLRLLLFLVVVLRHLDLNLLDLLNLFRNLIINEVLLLLSGRIIFALRGSFFSHCVRDDYWCLLVRRLLGGEASVDCDLLHDWLDVAAKFIDLTLLGVIDDFSSRRNGISLNSLVDFLKTWCRNNLIFFSRYSDDGGTSWLARLTDCSNIRLSWLLISFWMSLRGQIMVFFFIIRGHDLVRAHTSSTLLVNILNCRCRHLWASKLFDIVCPELIKFLGDLVLILLVIHWLVELLEGLGGVLVG